jgi:hypothetical protein
MAVNISRYRKTPRPSYFNASTGTESPITEDFETWLLELSNQDKQSLITRLQKSLTSFRVNGPRDNLMRVALDFQAMNAGSAAQELNVTLQEFTNMSSDLTDDSGAGIDEISLMLSDISKCYGEPMFRSRVEQNNLVATSFLADSIGYGIGSGVSAESKKQIGSWINIIASYILPGT